ncbi:hypothetical protein BH10ACI4_BH10ACI4_00430 [soil metagenome]
MAKWLVFIRVAELVSFRFLGARLKRKVSAGSNLETAGVTPGDAAGALTATKAEVSGRPAVPATGVGSEKYQRILDAAVEVIAENGYFSSPVSAIAARAGVADGTIYLYFKSKDDVLRTAIDTTFDRFHKQVAEKFETLEGPREQLEYIAQVHLESHAVNRSMAILMQTEVRQSAKFIAEFSHHHLVKYIQVVREVIRRGQKEGIFRADVSDGVVAHCMFGAIDELLSSAVFTGRVYDAKATAAQVLDVLLNGIKA